MGECEEGEEEGRREEKKMRELFCKSNTLCRVSQDLHTHRNIRKISLRSWLH